MGPVFVLDPEAAAPLMRLLAPLLAPDESDLVARAVSPGTWHSECARFAFAYPPLDVAASATRRDVHSRSDSDIAATTAEAVGSSAEGKTDKTDDAWIRATSAAVLRPYSSIGDLFLAVSLRLTLLSTVGAPVAAAITAQLGACTPLLAVARRLIARAAAAQQAMLLGVTDPVAATLEDGTLMSPVVPSDVSIVAAVLQGCLSKPDILPALFAYISTTPYALPAPALLCAPSSTAGAGALVTVSVTDYMFMLIRGLTSQFARTAEHALAMLHAPGCPLLLGSGAVSAVAHSAAQRAGRARARAIRRAGAGAGTAAASPARSTSTAPPGANDRVAPALLATPVAPSNGRSRRLSLTVALATPRATMGDDNLHTQSQSALLMPPEPAVGANGVSLSDSVAESYGASERRLRSSATESSGTLGIEALGPADFESNDSGAVDPIALALTLLRAHAAALPSTQHSSRTTDIGATAAFEFTGFAPLPSMPAILLTELTIDEPATSVAPKRAPRRSHNATNKTSASAPSNDSLMSHRHAAAAKGDLTSRLWAALSDVLSDAASSVAVMTYSPTASHHDVAPPGITPGTAAAATRTLVAERRALLRLATEVRDGSATWQGREPLLLASLWQTAAFARHCMSMGRALSRRIRAQAAAAAAAGPALAPLSRPMRRWLRYYPAVHFLTAYTLHVLPLVMRAPVSALHPTLALTTAVAPQTASAAMDDSSAAPGSHSRSGFLSPPPRRAAPALPPARAAPRPAAASDVAADPIQAAAAAEEQRKRADAVAATQLTARRVAARAAVLANPPPPLPVVPPSSLGNTETPVICASHVYSLMVASGAGMVLPRVLAAFGELAEYAASLERHTAAITALEASVSDTRARNNALLVRLQRATRDAQTARVRHLAYVHGGGAAVASSDVPDTPAARRRRSLFGTLSSDDNNAAANATQGDVRTSDGGTVQVSLLPSSSVHSFGGPTVVTPMSSASQATLAVSDEESRLAAAVAEATEAAEALAHEFQLRPKISDVVARGIAALPPLPPTPALAMLPAALRPPWVSIEQMNAAVGRATAILAPPAAYAGDADSAAVPVSDVVVDAETGAVTITLASEPAAHVDYECRADKNVKDQLVRAEEAALPAAPEVMSDALSTTSDLASNRSALSHSAPSASPTAAEVALSPMASSAPSFRAGVDLAPPPQHLEPAVSSAPFHHSRAQHRAQAPVWNATWASSSRCFAAGHALWLRTAVMSAEDAATSPLSLHGYVCSHPLHRPSADAQPAAALTTEVAEAYHGSAALPLMSLLCPAAPLLAFVAPAVPGSPTWSTRVPLAPTVLSSSASGGSSAPAAEAADMMRAAADQSSLPSLVLHRAATAAAGGDEAVDVEEGARSLSFLLAVLDAAATVAAAVGSTIDAWGPAMWTAAGVSLLDPVFISSAQPDSDMNTPISIAIGLDTVPSVDEDPVAGGTLLLPSTFDIAPRAAARSALRESVATGLVFGPGGAGLQLALRSLAMGINMLSRRSPLDGPSSVLPNSLVAAATAHLSVLAESAALRPPVALHSMSSASSLVSASESSLLPPLSEHFIDNMWRHSALVSGALYSASSALPYLFQSTPGATLAAAMALVNAASFESSASNATRTLTLPIAHPIFSASPSLTVPPLLPRAALAASFTHAAAANIEGTFVAPPTVAIAAALASALEVRERENAARVGLFARAASSSAALLHEATPRASFSGPASVGHHSAHSSQDWGAMAAAASHEFDCDSPGGNLALTLANAIKNHRAGIAAGALALTPFVGTEGSLPAGCAEPVTGLMATTASCAAALLSSVPRVLSSSPAVAAVESAAVRGAVLSHPRLLARALRGDEAALADDLLAVSEAALLGGSLNFIPLEAYAVSAAEGLAAEADADAHIAALKAAAIAAEFIHGDGNVSPAAAATAAVNAVGLPLWAQAGVPNVPLPQSLALSDPVDPPMGPAVSGLLPLYDLGRGARVRGPSAGVAVYALANSADGAAPEADVLLHLRLLPDWSIPSAAGAPRAVGRAAAHATALATPSLLLPPPLPRDVMVDLLTHPARVPAVASAAAAVAAAMGPTASAVNSASSALAFTESGAREISEDSADSHVEDFSEDMPAFLCGDGAHALMALSSSTATTPAHCLTDAPRTASRPSLRAPTTGLLPGAVGAGMGATTVGGVLAFAEKNCSGAAPSARCERFWYEAPAALANARSVNSVTTTTTTTVLGGSMTTTTSTTTTITTVTSTPVAKTFSLSRGYGLALPQCDASAAKAAPLLRQGLAAPPPATRMAFPAATVSALLAHVSRLAPTLFGAVRGVAALAPCACTDGACAGSPWERVVKRENGVWVDADPASTDAASCAEATGLSQWLSSELQELLHVGGGLARTCRFVSAVARSRSRTLPHAGNAAVRAVAELAAQLPETYPCLHALRRAVLTLSCAENALILRAGVALQPVTSRIAARGKGLQPHAVPAPAPAPQGRADAEQTAAALAGLAGAPAHITATAPLVRAQAAHALAALAQAQHSAYGVETNNSLPLGAPGDSSPRTAAAGCLFDVASGVMTVGAIPHQAESSQNMLNTPSDAAAALLTLMFPPAASALACVRHSSSQKAAALATANRRRASSATGRGSGANSPVHGVPSSPKTTVNEGSILALATAAAAAAGSLRMGFRRPLSAVNDDAASAGAGAADAVFLGYRGPSSPPQMHADLTSAAAVAASSAAGASRASRSRRVRAVRARARMRQRARASGTGALNVHGSAANPLASSVGSAASIQTAATYINRQRARARGGAVQRQNPAASPADCAVGMSEPRRWAAGADAQTWLESVALDAPHASADGSAAAAENAPITTPRDGTGDVGEVFVMQDKDTVIALVRSLPTGPMPPVLLARAQAIALAAAQSWISPTSSAVAAAPVSAAVTVVASAPTTGAANPRPAASTTTIASAAGAGASSSNSVRPASAVVAEADVSRTPAPSSAAAALVKQLSYGGSTAFVATRPPRQRASESGTAFVPAPSADVSAYALAQAQEFLANREVTRSRRVVRAVRTLRRARARAAAAAAAAAAADAAEAGSAPVAAQSASAPALADWGESFFTALAPALAHSVHGLLAASAGYAAPLALLTSVVAPSLVEATDFIMPPPVPVSAAVQERRAYPDVSTDIASIAVEIETPFTVSTTNNGDDDDDEDDEEYDDTAAKALSARPAANTPAQPSHKRQASIAKSTVKIEVLSELGSEESTAATALGCNIEPFWTPTTAQPSFAASTPASGRKKHRHHVADLLLLLALHPPVHTNTGGVAADVPAAQAASASSPAASPAPGPRRTALLSAPSTPHGGAACGAAAGLNAGVGAGASGNNALWGATAHGSVGGAMDGDWTPPVVSTLLSLAALSPLALANRSRPHFYLPLLVALALPVRSLLSPHGLPSSAALAPLSGVLTAADRASALPQCALPPQLLALLFTGATAPGSSSAAASGTPSTAPSPSHGAPPVPSVAVVIAAALEPVAAALEYPVFSGTTAATCFGGFDGSRTGTWLPGTGLNVVGGGSCADDGSVSSIMRPQSVASGDSAAGESETGTPFGLPSVTLQFSTAAGGAVTPGYARNKVAARAASRIARQMSMTTQQHSGGAQELGTSEVAQQAPTVVVVAPTANYGGSTRMGDSVSIAASSAAHGGAVTMVAELAAAVERLVRHTESANDWDAAVHFNPVKYLHKILQHTGMM